MSVRTNLYETQKKQKIIEQIEKYNDQNHNIMTENTKNKIINDVFNLGKK